MSTRNAAVNGVSQSPSPAATEIRAYVDTLISSPAFSNSHRRAKLLQYLVECTLDGRGERINEYAIGVDVFEKPPSFDPRLESVVRTQFSRLRQKLREHYAGAGSADRIQIDFPQRSYVPAFTFREPASESREPAMPRIGARIWLAAVAFVVLVVAAIVIWRTRTLPSPRVSSVVVLPFQNLSSDHHDDYIADGLTEEVTNDLAQSKDTRVVARTSAWLFKGKAVDIRDVGQRLKVSAALEGSFSRTGSGIRVTAQLNRTSDGYHIWSHSYTADSDDLSTLEHDIAEAVLSEVHGGKRQAEVTTDSSKDPGAHDLYLRANYERSLNTPDSFKRSLALFQQAVIRDPSYASAYVGIARDHISLLHLTQEPPETALPAARSALQKALQLQPGYGEARGLLANIIAIYDWDWPKAQREFERALEEGAQSTTRSLYGSLLATRGQFRQAEAQARMAEDLDPLSMGPAFNLFTTYNLEHNFEESKHVLARMLEMHPDLIDAHFMSGVVAVTEHNCGLAHTEFTWCARKFSAPLTKIGLALASACSGDRTRAQSYLADATKPSTAGYTSPYQLALAYATIGDKEKALAYLAKSADAKEMQIFYIRYDPLLDGIRSDPRFVALEKRVGLL